MATETDYGYRQLATRLGLTSWQMRLAEEHGLLPEPDAPGGRWSAEAAEACAGRTPQIIAAFGDRPPIGAGRAAARLAPRVGLDVERADIEVLVARGDLTVVSRYQDYPVYLLRDLDGIDPGTVTEIVTARKGPLLDTVDAGGAARILEWPKSLFDRVAAERELATDQLGRYSLAAVRALSADETLAQRVADDRLRTTLRKARKDEARFEEAVRDWLLRCTAYLDRAADGPPDTAPAARALRSLAAARSAVARHDGR